MFGASGRAESTAWSAWQTCCSNDAQRVSTEMTRRRTAPHHAVASVEPSAPWRRFTHRARRGGSHRRRRGRPFPSPINSCTHAFGVDQVPELLAAARRARVTGVIGPWSRRVRGNAAARYKSRGRPESSALAVCPQDDRKSRVELKEARHCVPEVTFEKLFPRRGDSRATATRKPKTKDTGARNLQQPLH